MSEPTSVTGTEPATQPNAVLVPAPKRRPVAAGIMSVFAAYIGISSLFHLPIGLIGVVVAALLGFQAYRVYLGAKDSVRKALTLWWGLITVFALVFGIVDLNFAYIVVAVLTGAYTVYLLRGGKWLIFMV